MPTRQILCLSSGLTPQYKLDILRVLALPRGTHVQFRYGEGIISQSLRDALAANSLPGSEVLLAHVDCNEPAKLPDGACPITPCRHATLLRSTKIGSTFFLRYRVEEFSACSDLNSFRNAIAEDRPHWVPNDNEGGTRKGYWCFESSAVRSCPKNANLEAWQAVVKELRKSCDYSELQFFFAIVGFYLRGRDDPLLTVNGEFILKSERDYELKVLHFHPDADRIEMTKSVGLIRASVSGDKLQQVTSPVLSVDSPYDLKTFHFTTAEGLRRSFASVVLRIEDPGTGKPLESQPELYLPAVLSPLWWRAILFIVAIGVLLWLQQWISAKGPIGWERSFAILAIALGTGYFIVFGSKRPTAGG